MVDMDWKAVDRATEEAIAGVEALETMATLRARITALEAHNKLLDGLIGMLTQFDNASTIARDYKRRLSALEAPPTAPKVTESLWVAVQRGYDEWAAKPHNQKWVKRLDGTPIPNDLIVCIVSALTAAQENGQ